MKTLTTLLEHQTIPTFTTDKFPDFPEDLIVCYEYTETTDSETISYGKKIKKQMGVCQ